jgi:hypothetical protein
VPAVTAPPGACLNATGGFAGGYSLVRWEKYLEVSRPLFFVQLGANRGKGPHDPIYDYASRCGWYGLAFEPTAATFGALCKTYAPFPRVRPVRAAVADFEGVGRLQHVTRFCPSGECNSLLTKGMNIAWHQKRAGTNETEQVPVVSLPAVWKEVKEWRRDLSLSTGDSTPGPAIDIFVVDVEGMEVALLGSTKSALPEPRPRYILWEHKHIPPDGQKKIDARLKEQGYVYVADVPHPAKGGRVMHGGDSLYGLA